MVDRGPISDRANQKRRTLIVVFTLHLVLGLAGTLAVSRPVLSQMLDGVWPSKDELLALVPLAFALVGLIGLVHAVRKPCVEAFREAWPAPQTISGPITLRPAWSLLGKVLGTLGIAAFWNGIVSVFVYQAVTHKDDVFYLVMGLFMIPFVLVGLCLVGFFLYQVLALFNPRPLLCVGSSRAEL